MKDLTKQEMETLKQSECILFYYANSVSDCEAIFYKAFKELQKAIIKYEKLMFKECKSDNNKVIENYIKSDIASLNNLYN